MNRILWRRALSSAAILTLLLAASPASACFRRLEVRFADGAAEIANRAEIEAFLQVPVYGPRQKLNVDVAAAEYDLAARRAALLVDMLAAQGLDRGYIKTSASRRPEGKSFLMVIPGPLPPRGDPALAQVSPPPSTCGSRR